MPDELTRFAEAHPNGYEQIWKQSMVDELGRFLQECQENGLRVALVYPPEYSGARDLLNNRREIFALYHRLAAEYGVDFLNYSYHAMTNDTKYFYNSQHLNRSGADLFSATLADDLALLLERANSSTANRR